MNTNWLSIMQGIVRMGAWKVGSSHQTASTVAQDSVTRGEGGQKRQPQAAEIQESARIAPLKPKVRHPESSLVFPSQRCKGAPPAKVFWQAERRKMDDKYIPGNGKLTNPRLCTPVHRFSQVSGENSIDDD